MNITATNSVFLVPKKFSFKMNNTKSNTETLKRDEYVSNANNQEKKKKNSTWKNILLVLLIITLITDIIIEHKARMEEKAQKIEKELLEESIKKLKDESKKLEEQIQKTKDEINNLKNQSNTTSPKNNQPKIDPEAPKS